jgi:hypothetical protein
MTKRAFDESQPLVLETVRNGGNHTETYHDFTEEEVAEIRQKMLAWFGKVKRVMPWRKALSSTSPEELSQRAYEGIFNLI